jgi:hypothetical protein
VAVVGKQGCLWSGSSLPHGLRLWPSTRVLSSEMASVPVVTGFKRPSQKPQKHSRRSILTSSGGRLWRPRNRVAGSRYSLSFGTRRLENHGWHVRRSTGISEAFDLKRLRCTSASTAFRCRDKRTPYGVKRHVCATVARGPQRLTSPFAGHPLGFIAYS